MIKIRIKDCGRSLLRFFADFLILAGIVAIVAFLWGFSEGTVYQYVQGVHWTREAADVEPATTVPVATPRLARSQPQSSQQDWLRYPKSSQQDWLRYPKSSQQDWLRYPKSSQRDWLRYPLLPTLAMMLDRDPMLLGRLEVPRLKFAVMVRDGVDEDTLLKAAGHVGGTALPGVAGNTVILAHRDTFFRPLRGLEKGDTIHMRTARGRFTYKVESIAVIAPEAVELDQTPEPMLTLITCFPFTYTGPAPRRFVVRARMSQ